MRVSNLQITTSKDWSGITSKNHIGSIWQNKPQVASKIIGRMLAKSYGTTLDTMLDGLPTKTLDSDDDFTWELMGSSEQNVTLVEARYQGSVVTATDIAVGEGKQRFELVFPKRWFAPTEVIVGELNEKYPIQIESEYSEGGNTVYVCVAFGADAVASGIPGEELVAGKKFSKEYAPVEESFSDRGGEISYSSPTKFRNAFTRIRMQDTVPGNMVNRKAVGEFKFVDKSGQEKSFTSWTGYRDFRFYEEIRQAKNKALYYGQSTIKADGTLSNEGRSGQGLRAGFGIRQQMEVSNTYFYNRFTADLITNILTELAEGKLGMDERRFVIRTGERGAVLFHKAIKDEASGWTALEDNMAQSNVSSKLHQNSRAFGFQYTEFRAPNGIVVSVEVDPMYSDPVRNKIMAPSDGHFSGGVAESYRMDIFDIGTTDGEPNIQKVMSADSPEIFRYLPGMRDPFSANGSAPSIAVTSVDGYEIHYMCHLGAMVKDPTRTASLIPNILA